MARAVGLYNTAQEIGYPMTLKQAVAQTAKMVNAEAKHPDLTELKRQHEPVTVYLRRLGDDYVSVENMRNFARKTRECMKREHSELEDDALNVELFRRWTQAVRIHAESRGYRDL